MIIHILGGDVLTWGVKMLGTKPLSKKIDVWGRG